MKFFFHAHVFNWRKCIKLFHSVSRVKCDDVHLRLPPTIAELTNVDNNFCYQVHLCSTSTSSRYFFKGKAQVEYHQVFAFSLYFGFRAIFIGIVLTIRMAFLFNFVKKNFCRRTRKKSIEEERMNPLSVEKIESLTLLRGIYQFFLMDRKNCRKSER